MPVLNEVQQISDQQSEATPTDVELIRLIACRHGAPMLQEHVPLHVCQFSERIVDIRPKLSAEEFEDVSILDVVDNSRCVDMVVLPGVCRSIQVSGENGPP